MELLIYPFKRKNCFSWVADIDCSNKVSEYYQGVNICNQKQKQNKTKQETKKNKQTKKKQQKTRKRKLEVQVEKVQFHIRYARRLKNNTPCSS